MDSSSSALSVGQLEFGHLTPRLRHAVFRDAGEFLHLGVGNRKGRRTAVTLHFEEKHQVGSQRGGPQFGENSRLNDFIRDLEISDAGIAKGIGHGIDGVNNLLYTYTL